MPNYEVLSFSHGRVDTTQTLTLLQDIGEAIRLAKSCAERCSSEHHDVIQWIEGEKFGKVIYTINKI
ncbi:hypothetical protein UFOVP1192_18 [uncultured Caudovirales phage]|uniref:Uncharacterized protein n=1 Tax=uncultured Caudovirales phage TaxID=2100421 RepID=A0A6J5RBB8_9CAUD|nr:hypothetical protein UFOVP1192_18 [uncultured Caudovirales phage]